MLWRLVLFPCLAKRMIGKISFAVVLNCEGSAKGALCSTVHLHSLHCHHFPCLNCSFASSMICSFFYRLQNRKISVIFSGTGVFASTNSAEVHLRPRSMLPSLAGFNTNWYPEYRINIAGKLQFNIHVSTLHVSKHMLDDNTKQHISHLENVTLFNMTTWLRTKSVRETTLSTTLSK